MKAKVIFLTIGQAPRDDVLSEIIPLLPPRINIRQAGVLDNLKFEEVTRLAPERDEFCLTTRLKNKKTVIVGRSKIVPLLQAKIKELEKEGDLIALLCTDDFLELKSERPLILAFNLMKEQIETLNPKRILVFVPLEQQIEMSKIKWQRPSTQVLIYALNPYNLSSSLDPNVFFPKFMRLYEETDIIIFDCIGYPSHLSTFLIYFRAKTCLFPRLLLADRISQIISGKTEHDQP